MINKPQRDTLYTPKQRTEVNMIKSETNWLDKQTNCDSCEDTYPMGYLIPTSDGDSICEECCDIIELAEADENK